ASAGGSGGGGAGGTSAGGSGGDGAGGTSAGGSGGDGAGGTSAGGSAGGSEGGPVCSARPSGSTCPGTTAACESVSGGPPLWAAGTYVRSAIPFRILAPRGGFGEEYKRAIRQTALQWNVAPSGFAGFQECLSCSGRFISIIPGDGDGLQNPA